MNTVKTINLKKDQAVQYDHTKDDIITHTYIEDDKSGKNFKVSLTIVKENKQDIEYIGQYLKIEPSGVVFMAGSNPFKYMG